MPHRYFWKLNFSVPVRDVWVERYPAWHLCVATPKLPTCQISEIWKLLKKVVDSATHGIDISVQTLYMLLQFLQPEPKYIGIIYNASLKWLEIPPASLGNEKNPAQLSRQWPARRPAVCLPPAPVPRAPVLRRERPAAQWAQPTWCEHGKWVWKHSTGGGWRDEQLPPPSKPNSWQHLNS